MDENDRLEKLRKSLNGFAVLFVGIVASLVAVYNNNSEREDLLYLGSIAASLVSFEISTELGYNQAAKFLTSGRILGSADIVEHATKNNFAGCITSEPEDTCLTVDSYHKSFNFLVDRFRRDSLLAPRAAWLITPGAHALSAYIFIPNRSRIEPVIQPVEANLFLEVHILGTPLANGGVAILSDPKSGKVSVAVPIREFPFKGPEYNCLNIRCVNLQPDVRLERAIQALRIDRNKSELNGKYFVIGKRELDILVAKESGGKLTPGDPTKLIAQVTTALDEGQGILKIYNYSLNYNSFVPVALVVFVANLVYLQFFLPSLAVGAISSDKKYWIVRDHHGPLQFLTALFLSISPVLCLIAISVTGLAISDTSLSVFGYGIKLNPMMNEYSISKQMSYEMRKIIGLQRIDLFQTVELVLVPILMLVTARPTVWLLGVVFSKRPST